MKTTWVCGRVTGSREGKKAKKRGKRIITELLRRNMKTKQKISTVLVTKTLFCCCRYIGFE